MLTLLRCTLFCLSHPPQTQFCSSQKTILTPMTIAQLEKRQKKVYHCFISTTLYTNCFYFVGKAMDELHSTQDNSEVSCWEGTCHYGLGQTCRGLSFVCIMYSSLLTQHVYTDSHDAFPATLARFYYVSIAFCCILVVDFIFS